VKRCAARMVGSLESVLFTTFGIFRQGTLEEAKHYERIKELDDEVELAEGIHLMAKESAKQAKDAWEAAVARLRLSRSAGSTREMTLKLTVDAVLRRGKS